MIWPVSPVRLVPRIAPSRPWALDTGGNEKSCWIPSLESDGTFHRSPLLLGAGHWRDRMMPRITIARRRIGAVSGTPGKLVMYAGVAEMRRSAARAIALLVLLSAASGHAQESSLVVQTPEVGAARLTVEESAP